MNSIIKNGINRIVKRLKLSAQTDTSVITSPDLNMIVKNASPGINRIVQFMVSSSHTDMSVNTSPDINIIVRNAHQINMIVKRLKLLNVEKSRGPSEAQVLVSNVQCFLVLNV